MKKSLFCLTMTLGLLLPLNARAQDVSINLFYDNLSPEGSWFDVAGYGYCFQPNVAAEDPNWRPYTDGYWAYTDAGWTWVSYEDFGWATYHYGRWAELADIGWVWVPGYDWAPAWVSWRTGGDYVGWAPLPPAVVYEGTAIAGNIDVQFDIGPLYYNFVDVRYIGEPVLSGRIFAPQQNITIINQTVNVTNITNNNNNIINNGPDFRRLNQYSQRPIQRLTLNRTTTLPGGGASGNLNHVNGNQLTVVAPAIQKTAGKIAPAQVKRTVAQPKIENGWQGLSNRAQLEAAMKKENPRAIPPPTVKPQKNRPNESIANAPVRPENDETANTPPPARDRVQNPNPARPQTPSGAMRPMVPAQNQTEPETATSETRAAEPAKNQELQRQQLQQRQQQLQQQQAQREQQQEQAAQRERAAAQREAGQEQPPQFPNQPRRPQTPNAGQNRSQQQEQDIPGPNAQQRKPKKNPNQEQTPSLQQP